MVYRIADNVLSPLGDTTAKNSQALREGRSALKHHASYSGRREDDYVAARFSDQQRERLMVEGMTWFESLVFQSIQEALNNCSVPLTEGRILLVLSTTKANIDLLNSNRYDGYMPGESAQRIAKALGLAIDPLVVCNACISGVAAIVIAQRLLDAGYYDAAIVTGCDVVSHFVVSGFQSLKALSPEPCRPFDLERTGLNLGEAAATLILSSRKPEGADWLVLRGALRNDAYHISSPSPKGEGCASAIRAVTAGIDPSCIAAVNAHGTATMYNDQMESKAIAAAGLSAVPVNTLKGYFGHTLGASGILETILTMHAVEQGRLPASLGFHESGVSDSICISDQPLSVSRQAFVKIISGFGGGNAALLCGSGNRPKFGRPLCSFSSKNEKVDILVEHHVSITSRQIFVDSHALETTMTGQGLLTEAYKRYVKGYPKYYKMDGLSQLGFVASELLLQQEQPRLQQTDERAVVLFNHTSSVSTDHEYEQTIGTGERYFPSPSLFIYTLPNMACGEIALRNGYRAETAFYILPAKDEEMMRRVLKATFMDGNIRSILAGWIDYRDGQHFEADFKLINKIKNVTLHHGRTDIGT